VTSDLKRPGAGWGLLAVLILFSPLIQGGTPRLPVLVVELALAALLGSWAVAWARAPRRELRIGLADALLALLLFWGLSSTLFAPYYHDAERVLLPLALCAGLAWFLAFHPSFSGLAVGLGAVRLQAVLQALLVLWQRLGASEPRPAGTFYNPNFLAGFLAAAALLSLGAILYAGGAGAARRRWAAWRFAEVGLCLVALTLTGSRGGMLALAAGLLVLLGLRSWRLTLAVFAAGAAALTAIPNPWFARLATLGREDAFAWTRLAIWKSAWAMLADHPWLGVGCGQFEHVSPQYAFPVTTHWAHYSRVAENAHNEFLQAGAELGVAGLLLALAVPAFFAYAARRRLRELPRERWGEVVPLLAALAALAAHAAVDFPLHTFPGGLLLVLLAAGLRLRGVTGPERVMELRFRPFYGVAGACLALLLAAAAVRPVAGFWYFARSLGVPMDLFHEKWAIEKAPRRQVALGESVRLLERAVAIDSVSAPYHRALGSLLFRSYLRGEAGEDALSRALYHLSYATELNPSNYQYFANLGEAMTSLARRSPAPHAYFKKALAAYRHAASLAPYYLPVYGEIGGLEDELGDRAAAEAAFRRAVELEEYYLRGWLNLGTFYGRGGRTEEARQTYRRGAELAEKARYLVPTTPSERELIALEPSVFYNELKKLETTDAVREAS
jgi:O-antigen ligase/Flp pilus assembly protein TadD